MKEIIIIIFILSMSICCFCIAAYMLFNDKQGWGWFLFASLFILIGVKISSTNSTNED